MKSRGVAIALAFFLGGLGLHKFYLNQPGRGVLYVLFCWTLVPMILSLLTFVNLLFMTNNQFNQRYNQQWLKILKAAA